MRRFLLISLAAALCGLVVLVPASAGSRPWVPHGFIGVSPQGPTDESDYRLMAEADVDSVRLFVSWSGIEPQARNRFSPEWGALDEQVRLAAEQGIRPFFFVWGTPEWLSPRLGGEPVTSARQRREWLRFLHDVEFRYGPRGRFWGENPELPFLPVREWEIWNEENIVTFSRVPDPERFGELIQISGRFLHHADPGSTVILGGLFGHPLQIPPNIASGYFLTQVYRIPGIERDFDGVALHPYVASASALRGEIEDLRRVMRENQDGGTPLYMTELGWGSAGYESRWERGPQGQAREMNRAFTMLAENRRRWRIGGIWWFSWADLAGSCQFCDSAGLLTAKREAKPSWYRFNAWTGGDAATVPRATSRALRRGP